MADSLGERCLLVEYGSGSSIKTRWLLDHLAHPVAYVPLDISHAHLLRAAHSLSAAYPGLPVLPLCADFTLPFALPRAPSRPRRTVVYFPGSSVGNFHPHEAAAFLSQARRVVGASGALLIGVDLEKDPALLERAYNDGAGVTAEFNRNVLARINRELGAGFDLDQFRHHALYDRDLRRIEMHLISMHDQIARIGSERVAFRRGESIITEYSYKYPPGGFERLAARAGFNHRRTWTDAAGLFGVHLFDAAT